MENPVLVPGLCVSCSDTASEISIKILKGEPMLTLTTGITICIPIQCYGDALGRFHKAQEAQLDKVQEPKLMTRVPLEARLHKAEEEEHVKETVEAVAMAESQPQQSGGHGHVEGNRDTEVPTEKVKKQQQEPSTPTRLDAHTEMSTATEKTDSPPRRSATNRYSQWLRSQRDTKDEGENAKVKVNEVNSNVPISALVDAELKQVKVQEPSTKPSNLYSSPVARKQNADIETSSPSSLNSSPVVHTQDVDSEISSCANRSCFYRVHSQHRQLKIFGYCCGSCAENGEHGPRCEKMPAPSGSRKGPIWADRTRLACNTPGCHFLVNPQQKYGGYCCNDCVVTNDHSVSCQGLYADRSCQIFTDAWQSWKATQ